MILVAAALLLVAVGLLAGGLAQGSAALQWGSFAASALAALALAVGELRRRRAGRDEAAAARVAAPPGTSEPASARAEVAALVTAPSRPQAPAAPAAPPATTAEPAPVVDEPAAAQVAQPIEEPPPTPVRSSAHAADRSGPSTGAHAAVPRLGADGEPPVEEVEVTDLLVVLDLTDEVLVVDEHPRYHLAGCPLLAGADALGIPMDEARADGFTPCGVCAPERNLAGRERARRTG